MRSLAVAAAFNLFANFFSSGWHFRDLRLKNALMTRAWWSSHLSTIRQWGRFCDIHVKSSCLVRKSFDHCSNLEANDVRFKNLESILWKKEWCQGLFSKILLKLFFLLFDSTNKSFHSVRAKSRKSSIRTVLWENQPENQFSNRYICLNIHLRGNGEWIHAGMAILSQSKRTRKI